MTHIDIYEEKHCSHCAAKYAEPYFDSPVLELIGGDKNIARFKCTTCGVISEYYT